MTSTSTYRLRGINDDVTTCDHCGREELKATMILEFLDADGNSTGETVRYGTTCGARALAARGITGVKGADLRRAAEVAEHTRRAEAADARRWLTDLDLPLAGPVEPAAFEAAALRYQAANLVGGIDPRPLAVCRVMLARSIERRQAAIAA